jgi:hypothetical protein
LVEFLKTVENDALAAGDLSRIRHASPEGGLDTVGFGHKLTRTEDEEGSVYGYSLDSLTLEQAEAVLRQDVAKAEDSLRAKLKAKHNTELEMLSPRKQAMLIDYEFNVIGGIYAFPKFTKAVIAGNRRAQEAEYMRVYTDSNGNVHPLPRNVPFFSTFMSRAAIRELGD